jgi:NTP pyrophosphatase (non-canonical NTP hydrolase)
MSPSKTASAGVAVLALGLAGETGEVVEHVKKYLGHGHALDLALVQKELGDVLWYVSALASYLDLDLNTIGEQNIQKLRERYPEGFSHEASRNRP